MALHMKCNSDKFLAIKSMLVARGDVDTGTGLNTGKDLNTGVRDKPAGHEIF